jgi:bifunctional DNA-binding transcriptional regulator/antitoxin component of YhaV-PrlF toxin-antitoxin module
MSYTLDVQEATDGAVFIILPDDFIDEVGWGEGDILEWDVKGNGIQLNRLNESAGFEAGEE